MKADPITGLTGPQEVFCRELIKGGNASEAYRKAYPRSLQWLPKTVNEKASVMQTNDKVQARLSQLRSDLREASGITLEDHLAELRELREMAKASAQLGAAITAETNRGKVSGLYVEKTELTGKGGGPVQVEKRMLIIEGVEP